MLIIGASAHLLNPSSPLSYDQIIDHLGDSSSGPTVQVQTVFTVDDNNTVEYLDPELTTLYYYNRHGDTDLFYYTAYNPINNETVYFNSYKVAFSIVPGKV